MTTTGQHYYGVWVHPAEEQPKVWSRPDYIVRSEEPRLVAATALFQNDGGMDSHAGMINHMHVEMDGAHQARAVVEYGLNETASKLVQPIGTGGEQWAATAILIPRIEVKAWQSGTHPCVNVLDQLIKAVECSDIVNARKVLDRIDAPKRPLTPGYAAAEAHRQLLVREATRALRTAEDRHMRMPDDFVIFDLRNRYHVIQVSHANDSDDATMTRIVAEFSSSGAKLS